MEDTREATVACGSEAISSGTSTAALASVACLVGGPPLGRCLWAQLDGGRIQYPGSPRVSCLVGRRHKQGTGKRRAGPLLKMRVKDLGLHKDNILTGPDSHLSWQPGMDEWIHESMERWENGYRY